MKKTHIEIGNLVLHGFDFHDHRRISRAVEDELSRLVTEQGLSKLNSNNVLLDSIVVDKINSSAHPKKIGSAIATQIHSKL